MRLPWFTITGACDESTVAVPAPGPVSVKIGVSDVIALQLMS